ncbi:dihydrolipoyl dehydrogenase family protein [Luteimonas suaedae]|uniref:dihydrolipoyl dehydrogenase family protein n=1 Tax=Luteimonas suaedae TaxID=2605430 RepID=UPI0011EC57C0|nr:NAD(P)/FAD-dependent oxidoreductase [Luteimonas suaedae]
MAKHYRLVVVGTGTAARVVATRVRAAGWSVAVIDFRPLGGTCALRGCDPKKVLIGGASAIDHVRRMRDKGVAGNVGIDWPGLMAFKRGFTDPVPAQQEAHYADEGIDVFRGKAMFTGPNAIDVDGETLEAEHVLIAAGAEAHKLGIPGEEYLVTNEGFLELDELPGRIVLVGGGYIAAEFSHLAARAGAEVTILQHGERILARFEPELVGWLMEKFGEVGIKVHTGMTVEAVEKTATGFRVGASGANGKATFEADLVVHAAGRTPALEALDLEAAGVAHDKGRLELNAYLQSASNPAVYAAGDCAQAGPPLTPVAGHDAKMVAANLLQGNHAKPDYTGVPSVAFTVPPIAAVGLTEAEARQQGLVFRVNCQKASSWFTSKQAAEPVYGHKVLIEEDSGRVLGAHLVGPHADEVINVFALAIRHGLTASQLATTMFAYPTTASDIAYMVE